MKEETRKLPEKTRRSVRTAELLLLVGVAGFLYLQLFLPDGVPIFMPTDHWIFLEHARQLLQGGILYRDVFQFTFPGAETTYAALLRIFGLKVWIPSLVLVVLGVALAWLTTALSRKVLNARSALLPASLLLSLGLYAWHIATHHWFGTAAAMAALLVLMSGRNPPRVAAAGACCGLSAWFTQTQGGGALLGLALFLLWWGRKREQAWRRVLRREGMLLAAFAATVVLTNAYFISKAGLENFLSATVLYPVRYFGSDKAWNSYHVYMAHLGRWQWWEVWPQAFFDIAVPASYLCFLLAYRRRRKSLPLEQNENVVLIALFGICMLAAVAPAPSFFRLCVVSPPALVLLVWMLALERPACRAVLKLLWFAALLSAVTVMYTTAGRERAGLALLNLPTGRAAFLDRVWFQEYRWLRDRTAPGQYFFGGRCGYFYFPLELNPPSDALFVTANGYTRPGQVGRLVEGLERHDVRFIMWQTELDHPLYYDAAGDPLRPLRAYARSQYRPVVRFPVMGDQILERPDAHWSL